MACGHMPGPSSAPPPTRAPRQRQTRSHVQDLMDVHWKHRVPRSLPDMTKRPTACEHLDKPSLKLGAHGVAAPRQSPRPWGVNTTDATGRGALPPTASGGRSSSLKASTGGEAQPPEARRMGGVGQCSRLLPRCHCRAGHVYRAQWAAGHSHQLPRRPTRSRSASKRFCAWLTQTARGRVGLLLQRSSRRGPQAQAHAH